MFTAVKKSSLLLALIILSVAKPVFSQGLFRPTVYSPAVQNMVAEEVQGDAIDEIPDGDDFTYFSRELPPTGSSGQWQKPGLWYFKGEVVMMHRSRAQKKELSGQATLAGTTPVLVDVALTTDDRRFGYEPGTRMTLGRFLGRDEKNRDLSVEFTYFGLFEWEASGGVSADSGLFLVTLLDDYTTTTPVPFAGFAGAVTQHYQYRSDFNSYELNMRVENRLGRDKNVFTDGVWHRELTPGFTWGFLGGLRYINVDEQFQFVSLGADPTTISGDYFVKTHNDLVGIQLGLDVREQHKKWNYGGFFKVGGFFNFADQDSRIRQVDTTLAFSPVATDSFREESADDDALVFLAEAGFFVNYEVKPNFIIHAGYEFMFLNGLALAPDQLTTNTAQGKFITTGGYQVYDGLSLGFTWYH